MPTLKKVYISIAKLLLSTGVCLHALFWIFNLNKLLSESQLFQQEYINNFTPNSRRLQYILFLMAYLLPKLSWFSLSKTYSNIFSTFSLVSTVKSDLFRKKLAQFQCISLFTPLTMICLRRNDEIWMRALLFFFTLKFDT